MGRAGRELRPACGHDQRRVCVLKPLLLEGFLICTVSVAITAVGGARDLSACRGANEKSTHRPVVSFPAHIFSSRICLKPGRPAVTVVTASGVCGIAVIIGENGTGVW